MWQGKKKRGREKRKKEGKGKNKERERASCNHILDMLECSLKEYIHVPEKI